MKNYEKLCRLIRERKMLKRENYFKIYMPKLFLIYILVTRFIQLTDIILFR